jgi:hypothetical protein
MVTEAVSLVSVVIAVSAVLVAVWQAQRTARAQEQIRSLPIVSEAFREWRSVEFRKHKTVLLSLTGTIPPEGGFEALPPDIQESAYTWCYFCEYLGQLVLYNIVPEELIIGFAGTQIPQLWGVMEPFIKKEREHRLRTLPEGVPPGFLAHYEHLVARIIARGGSTAADEIRKTHSAQKLTPEALRMLAPRENPSEGRRSTFRRWRRNRISLDLPFGPTPGRRRRRYPHAKTRQISVT